MNDATDPRGGAPDGGGSYGRDAATVGGNFGAPDSTPVDGDRLGRLLAAVPAFLYTAEVDGNRLICRSLSPGFSSVTGYGEEEACGHGSQPFWVHPDDRSQVDEVRRRILAGFPGTIEYRILRKDGAVRFVRETAVASGDEPGSPSRIDGIVADVTEQKEVLEANRRLQQQVFYADKMQAIGTLAGGIAHDFNNLLGVILGYASLLKRQIEPSHPHFRGIDMIERTAERAAALTRQLLGFARGGKYKAEPVAVNDVVRSVLARLGGDLGPSISVETELADGLPPTEGDMGQMEQMLTNLCLNARDAMPGGGRIRIGAGLAILGDDFVATRPWARRGEFLRLSVADTGGGMTPEVMGRVFEPFFTTRPSGKGSGMGLAMVYGAMKGHGGFVDVQSAPGEGAVFDLYFPVSWRAREDAEDPGVGEIARGTESVLVVDALEEAREAAAGILEGAGYRVLRAGTGEEACALLEAGARAETAVVDLGIPGMGARQAFLTFRGIDPRLPVVLATGRGVEGSASELLQMGGAGHVGRPYEPADLLRAVRRALDSKER